MKIYFLRHGEAGRAQADSLRPLTDKGKRQVEFQLAHFIEASPVSQIWSSHFLRAKQSADIIADYFQLSVHHSRLLEPDTSIDFLYEFLDHHAVEGALFVTHNPLVTKVINDLCGSPSHFLDMGVASLAAVEFEIAARDMGKLLWVSYVPGEV